MSMKKTLKISEECHKELTKILGEFMSRDPSIKTYEQAIMKLIKIYRDSTRK